MNKIALITGGAIRVGKAICLGLAKQGFDIIFIYNSSSKQALETKREIEALGRNCFIYQCDISNASNIKNVFDEIFATHKNISLVVNNASIFEKYSLMETNEDIFDRHININFKAPFFITQKYGEYCFKNNVLGANIVNVLDSYIETNSTAYFIYLLTKKSLLNLTKMSAVELGKKVRVNAISIGLLLPSQDWNEEKIAEKTKQTPLNKRITTEDIVNSIIALNENQALTGNNIFVDGGLQLI
jgi:NAD(P)-dependent dehydrogenase (short-subunit alcohol dehydrogenase family)